LVFKRAPGYVVLYSWGPMTWNNIKIKEPFIKSLNEYVSGHSSLETQSLSFTAITITASRALLYKQ
jgi:hypothetical protein